MDIGGLQHNKKIRKSVPTPVSLRSLAETHMDKEQQQPQVAAACHVTTTANWQTTVLHLDLWEDPASSPLLRLLPQTIIRDSPWMRDVSLILHQCPTAEGSPWIAAALQLLSRDLTGWQRLRIQPPDADDLPELPPTSPVDRHVGALLCCGLVVPDQTTSLRVVVDPAVFHTQAEMEHTVQSVFLSNATTNRYHALHVVAHDVGVDATLSHLEWFLQTPGVAPCLRVLSLVWRGSGRTDPAVPASVQACQTLSELRVRATTAPHSVDYAVCTADDALGFRLATAPALQSLVLHGPGPKQQQQPLSHLSALEWSLVGGVGGRPESLLLRCPALTVLALRITEPQETDVLALAVCLRRGALSSVVLLASGGKEARP